MYTLILGEKPGWLCECAIEQKRLGNYEEAVKIYMEAIWIAPKHSILRYGLGKVYYLAGKKEDSIRQYMMALHLSLYLADYTVRHDLDDKAAIVGGLKEVTGELVSAIDAIHPMARWLLVESELCRHIAHTLIDIEPCSITLDYKERSKVIGSRGPYRANIAGKNALVDRKVESSVYLPYGLAYAVERIRWDQIDNAGVDSLYSAMQTSPKDDGPLVEGPDAFLGAESERKRKFMDDFYSEKTRTCFEALRTGREEDALAVLKKYPNVMNRTDEHGSYPLHFAAHLGLAHTATFIIEQGGEVDIRDAHGQTPLHWAKSPQVAEILLKYGADLEARDGSGWTPLFAVSRDGHADAAKYLVSRGANVNAKSNRDGRFDTQEWSPLHIAVRKGRTDVVRFLLSKNANVRQPDTHGSNPIQVASDPLMKHLLQEAMLAATEATKTAAFKSSRNADAKAALAALAAHGVVTIPTDADGVFVALEREMSSLMATPAFRAEVARLLRRDPGIRGAIEDFAQDYRRHTIIGWDDLPLRSVDLSWRPLFTDRWNPVFLLMHSSVLPIFSQKKGVTPLIGEESTARFGAPAPVTGAIGQLMDSPRFWPFRNGIAHSSIRWRVDGGNMVVVKMKESSNVEETSMTVAVGEAFCVLSSCFWFAFLSQVIERQVVL